MLKHLTEDRVMRRLQGHGFVVEKIPEEARRTCDFRCTKSGVNYLIEVKSRELNDDLKNQLIENNGFDDCLDMGVGPSVLKILKEAAKQLEETSKSPGSLRIIWIVISDKHLPELKLRELQMTIYGIKDMKCSVDGFFYNLDCYYWRIGFFTNKPEIPVIVVEDAEGLRFYLNDRSPRLSDLKNSPLWALPKLSVTDPLELEKACCCLLGPVRGDEQARLKFLAARYGFGTIEPQTKREYFSHRSFRLS